PAPAPAISPPAAAARGRPPRPAEIPGTTGHDGVGWLPRSHRPATRGRPHPETNAWLSRLSFPLVSRCGTARRFAPRPRPSARRTRYRTPRTAVVPAGPAAACRGRPVRTGRTARPRPRAPGRGPWSFPHRQRIYALALLLRAPSWGRPRPLACAPLQQRDTRLSQTLIDRLEEGIVQIAAFLPQLAAALGILLAGYAIAKMIERGAEKALRKIGFDRWMHEGGVIEALERAVTTLDPSTALAKLVFWTVMLLVILLAANALGLMVVSTLFSE